MRHPHLCRCLCLCLYIHRQQSCRLHHPAGASLTSRDAGTLPARIEGLSVRHREVDCWRLGRRRRAAAAGGGGSAAESAAAGCAAAADSADAGCTGAAAVSAGAAGAAASRPAQQAPAAAPAQEGRCNSWRRRRCCPIGRRRFGAAGAAPAAGGVAAVRVAPATLPGWPGQRGQYEQRRSLRRRRVYMAGCFPSRTSAVETLRAQSACCRSSLRSS